MFTSFPFALSTFRCAFACINGTSNTFISSSMQSSEATKSIETNNNVNIDKCQKIYCLQNSNDFALFLHAVGCLQGRFQHCIIYVLWTWMFAKVKVSLYVWLFVYFLFFSSSAATAFLLFALFVCVCAELFLLTLINVVGYEVTQSTHTGKAWPTS